jgi:hypothetical protein
VDLGDALHLDEVVARAERSELRPAALLGALGDLPGIGPLEPSALLDMQEIVRLAEPLPDRPGGAPGQKLLLARRVQPEILAAGPDARRDVAEQGLDQIPDPSLRLPRAQT